MKYLTIIRHAKSSWENPALTDIDRPLNARGKKAIHIIGKFLLGKNIQPDLILVSPAKRAKQTAIGIGKYINFSSGDLLIKQDIYSSFEHDIVKLICTVDNHYSEVFLFGHEPVLSLLIEILTNNKIEKFPTCAVYRIAFDVTKWKEIKHGTMELFITPKQLNA